ALVVVGILDLQDADRKRLLADGGRSLPLLTGLSRRLCWHSWVSLGPLAANGMTGRPPEGLSGGHEHPAARNGPPDALSITLSQAKDRYPSGREFRIISVD